MADDIQTCPIQGNPDLYGLGVRLGLYLQFIALVFARPTVKLAFKTINSSTIAFILANFIVLIRQTTQGTLLAPEAYLLFFLLVPQLAVNMIGADLWSGLLGLRGVIAVILSASFTYYFTWFWWIGLDVLPMSGCGDEYGFFFTRVSLRGWFRTFNKVIWTIAGIAMGVLLVILPIHALIRACIMRALRKEQANRDLSVPSPRLSTVEEDSSMEAFRTLQGARPTGERFILHNIIQHIFLQGWSFLPFIIFVTGAEITIRYNDIQGVNTVNSASQLVPLILALGLLVHIISKTSMKLSHGFRHAFDEAPTEQAGDGDDQSSIRSELRRELREERGWLGAIGRFLFRVYCAFAVGYNEDEEEESSQSGPGTGCPKTNQYSTVEVELEGGARP